METYGLDAMFVFTVTMGLTAFLMAWSILVVAIKGWNIRHRRRSPHRSNVTIHSCLSTM